MDWFDLAQDLGKWRAFVKTVMKDFGVTKCGGFLICYLLKKVSASWS